MIDLTNKTPEEVETVIKKYEEPLKEIYSRYRDESMIPNLAFIIDHGVDHINGKYKDLNADWKAMLIVLLKINIKNINKESDINDIINKFMKYHKSNYEEYLKNVEMSASDFDKYITFMNTFKYISKEDKKLLNK